MEKNKYTLIFPSIIWSLGAVTFLIQYACRVAPSGMIDPIMSDFVIGAAMAGYISSAFYYAYIMMQLFVGKWVDQYSAHRVLIITTFVFLMANQLFSESMSMTEVVAARAVMGAMGAFAFVCTMKLALIWFEGRYLGVLSGLTQVFGMLGVVFGNYIVDTRLINDEWRPVMKIFSGYLIVLLLLMFIIMKDKKQSVKDEEPVGLISGLMQVSANPQSWYNGLFAGLIYLPTAAFGEYWGIQYLTKTSIVMSKHQASIAIDMIFIGWAIGGILMGLYSDYLQKRKPLLLGSPLICMVLLLPVLYIHTLPAVWVYSLLFCYGFFNSALVIAYAISGEINALSVSGVSIAFCNMLSILLGSIVLPLIGYFIDSFLARGMAEAVAYESAVAVFPIALFIAFIIAYYVQETHCKRA